MSINIERAIYITHVQVISLLVYIVGDFDGMC